MRNLKLNTTTQSTVKYAKNLKSWWVLQKSEPIHVCKKFKGKHNESQNDIDKILKKIKIKKENC